MLLTPADHRRVGPARRARNVVEHCEQPDDDGCGHDDRAYPDEQPQPSRPRPLRRLRRAAVRYSTPTHVSAPRLQSSRRLTATPRTRSRGRLVAASRRCVPASRRPAGCRRSPGRADRPARPAPTPHPARVGHRGRRTRRPGRRRGSRPRCAATVRSCAVNRMSPALRRCASAIRSVATRCNWCCTGPQSFAAHSSASSAISSSVQPRSSARAMKPGATDVRHSSDDVNQVVYLLLVAIFIADVVGCGIILTTR